MNNQPEKRAMTPSNNAAEDAQATTAEKMSYSGGNAMLDAEISLQSQATEPGLEHPNATNTPEEVSPDQPIMKTTGAYPPSLNQLTDQSEGSIAKDSPNS